MEKTYYQTEKKLEQKFVDYYENESKTGFYIHTNPEDADSEEVQFFNYNEEGGWWIKQNNTYVFFDSNAAIVDFTKEPFNKEKYTLKQFSSANDQAKINFNIKDYALIVIYAEKKTLEDFKTKFDKKFKNLALSDVKEHESNEKYFRLTVFIAKYNEFEGDKAIELSALLEEITKLPKQLSVTCVVKEEIKFFFNDFEEDIKTIITDYTQEHRYECLYNSESDHSEKSSDDDDDDDDEEAKHSNKGDEEEDEDEDRS